MKSQQVCYQSLSFLEARDVARLVQKCSKQSSKPSLFLYPTHIQPKTHHQAIQLAALARPFFPGLAFPRAPTTGLWRVGSLRWNSNPPRAAGWALFCLVGSYMLHLGEMWGNHGTSGINNKGTAVLNLGRFRHKMLHLRGVIHVSFFQQSSRKGAIDSPQPKSGRPKVSAAAAAAAA